MKKNTLMFFVIVGIVFAGCVKEGPMGPEGIPGRDGRDGNANVYYSQWYPVSQWAGKTGDWYFDIEDNAITQEIVESGVILAYMSVPGDIYANAVRPMPAYTLNANWDFLIPDYGTIEFTSDALNKPGTSNFYFRFVLIPSNISLKKSGSLKGLSVQDFKTMPYQEVCKQLGIPEE